MKRYAVLALALLSASLTIGLRVAPAADFLDRLKQKADEVADAAEGLERDAAAVTNAEATAAERADAAVRQTEQQAEGEVRGTVEATAPVRGVRAVERDVAATEREAARVAATDERAAAQLQGEVREAETALDVEGRAEAQVARSAPVVAAEAAEQSVRDAERTLAGAARADERAAAEAKESVDPQPALNEVDTSLERARRALRRRD